VKKNQPDKLIGRLLDACVAYARGKMTLKQVWYRARGQKMLDVIMAFPDRKLGELMFTLANDFLTWYGDRDDIIDETIRMIAEHLESTEPRPSRLQ
jgi:hypothetical protein